MRQKILSLLLIISMLMTNFIGNNFQYVHASEMNNESHFCELCGEKMRFDEKLEPTCSRVGYEEFWTCSNGDCDNCMSVVFTNDDFTKKLSLNDVTIPMVGHKMELISFKNCSKSADANGIFSYYVCAYDSCEEKLLGNAFLDENRTKKITITTIEQETGHNFVNYQSVPVGCETWGIAAHVKCSKCNGIYTDILGAEESTSKEIELKPTGHLWSEQYEFDEEQHWRICLLSECVGEKMMHVYNQEVPELKYLALEPNCTTPAAYFKSCICGVAGDEVFIDENGPTSTLHNIDNKYSYDNTYHFRKCLNANCLYRENVVEHVFTQQIVDEKYKVSDATCVTPAVYKKLCFCGAASDEHTFYYGTAKKHDMNIEWSYDAENHYKKCKNEGCDYKIETGTHEFDNWQIVSESTCTETGKEKRTCSVCCYVEERDLPLAVHVLKDGYENDARVHWNACENCNEKIDLATHNWEYGEIISESTCTEAGKQARHCSVCGHEDTVDLELADHEYGDEFFYDENEHYKKCSCGDKTDVSQHEDNEWNIVVEGDCETDTILERTCSCGYREEKTIKADGHQYEGQQFEYDVNSHWRECAICGTSEDESSHEFSDWNIINNATCQEEGLKERTCDCGYTETETISIGKHKYIIPNWDEAEHWMECECGDIETKTLHSLSDWITVSQPTCGSDGLSIKQCSGCEYVLEQYTKKENHDFEGEWKYNDTQHWYECQCGEPGEKSNHEMSEWETINPANCQTEGLEKRVCRTCPYFEEKVIGKTECDFSGDYVTNDGLHWKKCECGKIAFEAEHHFEHVEIIEESSCCKNGKELVKCAICEFKTEKELPLKEHEKSNELESDDNGHWFKCATENCEEQIELTTHLFDQEKVNSDNVAEDATCVSPAKYYKSCICGKYGKETFESGEKLDHKMSNEWSHDDKNHYYECTFDRCDYKENIEKHELSFLKELKEATCTVIGEELHKCGVCDAEITILKDYAAHIWETEITKDETNHWYECSNEDCNDKKDVVKHEFIQQVVAPEFLEKAATCVEKATYFKSCVCGAKGTETFEHGELSTEHDIEDKLYFDETNHFKKCSVEGCNYVSESEQHIFDKEVATEEFEAAKATCQAKAQYYKSCVCGKAGTEKFESGEVAKHVMGTTYEKDATGHWTKCTTEGCTEKSKVEEHTFKDGESKCSVCGQEKEHVCTLKEVSAKSATCEKAGNIAHYKCKECSKLYEDKDGKKEITEEKVIIAKTEHKNTWYITKEATKDKVGELKGKCSVCGTSTKMDLEKLGTSGKLTFDVDDDAKLKAELNTDDIYKLVELTTDEVKEINNGMGLNILLSIEDLDEDITSSDKKKMEEKMDDDYKLIKYLDITLTKQLLDDDKVKESDGVDETSEELEIVLEIPEKMQGKDTYKVLRLHNGKVEILDAEYDKDDKTIKFETDQFSTYAVVYEDKDAAKEDSKADSTTGAVMPDAGDNNIIFLWATMAMISAFGLSVMLQKKKED